MSLIKIARGRCNSERNPQFWAQPPPLTAGRFFASIFGVQKFFWRWVVLTVSVFVAANIRFLGIGYDNWPALLAAALLLGIANTVVKPVLMLIGLPLILLTFGLFVLVINALLFYAVGTLVRGFHVASFWSALGGSVVVSLVSLLAGVSRSTFQSRRPPRRPPPPGVGPVIDI